MVRIGFGREGISGDVSLPGYGPLRSDAILGYVQIVYHSSTLYSCVFGEGGEVFGIDDARELVSGQLNVPCLIDQRSRSNEYLYGISSLLVLWLSWDDVKLRPLSMLLLLSWDDVKLRPLWQWFYFVLGINTGIACLIQVLFGFVFAFFL